MAEDNELDTEMERHVMDFLEGRPDGAHEDDIRAAWILKKEIACHSALLTLLQEGKISARKIQEMVPGEMSLDDYEFKASR